MEDEKKKMLQLLAQTIEQSVSSQKIHSFYIKMNSQRKKSNGKSTQNVSQCKQCELNIDDENDVQYLNGLNITKKRKISTINNSEIIPQELSSTNQQDLKNCNNSNKQISTNKQFQNINKNWVEYQKKKLKEKQLTFNQHNSDNGQKNMNQNSNGNYLLHINGNHACNNKNLIEPNQNEIPLKLSNQPKNSKKSDDLAAYNYQSQKNCLYLSLEPDPKSYKGQTPIISLDCEMVMCESKGEGQTRELARISIVNYNSHVLLDKYVRPKKKIVNYLTWVSGILPKHLIRAPTLEEIYDEILHILKDNVVVGHSLQNDFSSIQIWPEEKMVRDIAKIHFLQKEGRPTSLKNMLEQHVGIQIQHGSHDSVEDARAALLIYKKFEKQIENVIKHKNYNKIKRMLLNDIKN